MLEISYRFVSITRELDDLRIPSQGGVWMFVRMVFKMITIPI